MNHLEHEGRGHSRLRAINARLLAIASEIDPSSARQYSYDELTGISEAWQSKLLFKGKTDQSAHIAKAEFHYVASGWLKFLGRIKPLVDDKPNSAQVNAFVTYLEHDLGYAEATRWNRRRTLEPFMQRAGVDINTIRGWLGHVSIDTTNDYAEADLEMKAKALAACEPESSAKTKRWRAEPALMEFLKNL
jgi:hypothetical protein